MQKVALVTGGNDVVVYSTLMGSLGCLVPILSREDVDFFIHLEMHMRQEHPPLCGRDHLAYRSYYFPVKVSQRAEKPHNLPASKPHSPSASSLSLLLFSALFLWYFAFSFFFFSAQSCGAYVYWH